MQILPKSGFKSMPWKNGGGETIEIMTWPQGSDLSQFEWRISMAVVATDGPFSLFPEIDRHLAILKGNGLTLSVGDTPPVPLTRDGKAFAFAGDSPTTATLTDGPITDLNVMVRRGLWQADVYCHCVEGSRRLLVDEGLMLLLVQDGSVTCSLDTGPHSLEDGDAAFFTAQDGSVLLEAQGANRLWQITLRQVKIA